MAPPQNAFFELANQLRTAGAVSDPTLFALRPELEQFGPGQLPGGLRAELTAAAGAPAAPEAVEGFQRRLGEESRTQELLGGLAQPIQQIDQRSQATFNQLREAGLLGLAEQFRRAQRANVFDVARRGTLGGSVSRERQAGLEAEREQGAADVTAQASGQAEGQRQQELGQLFGFQQQVAAGDPFLEQMRQLESQDIQQRGQAAQGQFGIQQQQQAITSGSELNRAQALNQLLSGIGMGIGGGIERRADARFLAGLQPPQEAPPFIPGVQSMTPSGRA